MPGLQVSLDHLEYRRAPANAPHDRPHLFVYFLTVENLGEEHCTLMARKWVVTYADGNQEVIEGDKIVGETPRLAPGEHFSYNSFHLTGQNAIAQGAFFGLTDHGERIHCRIPPFEMCIPPDIE